MNPPPSTTVRTYACCVGGDGGASDGDTWALGSVSAAASNPAVRESVGRHPHVRCVYCFVSSLFRFRPTITYDTAFSW